jgi:hypothetical protein
MNKFSLVCVKRKDTGTATGIYRASLSKVPASNTGNFFLHPCNSFIFLLYLEQKILVGCGFDILFFLYIFAAQMTDPVDTRQVLQPVENSEGDPDGPSPTPPQVPLLYT